VTKRHVSAKALGTRIRALTRKHRQIDQLIEIEQMRPRPDTNLVHRLKRQRLGLKDALHAAQRLARQGQPSGISAV
jgi:hypothetical protein